MVFESVEDYSDALLRSKALECSECRQLLQPPVMAVEKHGNVCHGCHQQNYSDSESATPNPAMDALLRRVNFECAYTYCNERIDLQDYRAHLEFCRYREIACEVDDCPWRGLRKAYLDHFIAEHRISCAAGEMGDIVNLKEEELQTAVLQTSCGSFVFHVVLTKDRCSFVVADIGHTRKHAAFTFLIKYAQGSRIYLVTCDLIQSNTILSGFTEVSAQVDREDLRIIFAKEPTISWQLSVDDGTLLDPYMLVDLDCSNCGRLLTPPTCSCPSGAGNICCRCYVADDDCGHCGLSLSRRHAENKAFNALLGQVRYPCRFKRQGCTVRCLAVMDHESTCSHMTWKCSSCPVAPLQYPDLVQHMLAEHPLKFDKSKHKYVSEHVNVCGGAEKMFWLGAFDRFFTVSHVCEDPPHGEHVCKWAVEHVGPKDCRFEFEVEIRSDQRPDQSLILRSECHYSDQPPYWYEIAGSAMDVFRHDNGQYGYTVRIKPYQPHSPYDFVLM